MARSAPTSPTPPASWTSSPSRRLARTSVSSTTPRAASLSTASPRRRLSTSLARSSASSSARAVSPSWLRTMREPSATLTRSSGSTTPSRSTLPPARSPTSSSSTLVSLPWSPVVVTWVVLVSSPTVSATMVVSTSSTSRMRLTTSSLLVRVTSSSLVVRSPGSACPRARVSSSPLLRSVTAAVPTPWPASKRFAKREGSTTGDKRDGRLKVGVSDTILHDGVANSLRSTDRTANKERQRSTKWRKVLIPMHVLPIEIVVHTRNTRRKACT